MKYFYYFLSLTLIKVTLYSFQEGDCVVLMDYEETDGYDTDPKIINGEKATRGQFPYQAALKIDEKLFCGGSLISRMWILTAAHCAYKVNEAVVYLGAQDLLVEEEGRITMRLREMLVHSNYNHHLNNDLALMKLLYKVKLTEYIKPVSLPRRSDSNKTLINETVTVSGWGYLSDESEHVHHELHYVNLTVIPNDECVKSYKQEAIIASTMCAIGQNTKNTCRGDSGGGLVIMPCDDYILVGVVSFGSHKGCASGNPSGYVRTASYLDWISNNTDVYIQN